MARFAIQHRPEVVQLTPAPASPRRRTARKLLLSAAILYALLVLAAASRSLLRSAQRPTLHPTSSLGPLLPMFVWAAVLLTVLTLTLLQREKSGQQTLTLSKAGLTLQTASPQPEALFARSAVRNLRFGAVHVSQYSTAMGLLFEHAGHTHKLLPGLEAPEAQTFLEFARQLAFDVQLDPGMPMLVEMVLSRRSGTLQRWLNQPPPHRANH